MNDGYVLDRAIRLGAKARGFFESELGREVAARAEADRQSALEDLASVDPTKPDEVWSLQCRVAAIDAALRWFASMIEEGDSALHVLDEEDDG